MDSGVASYMVNSEEKTTKLRYAKTQVTVGDSKTLTGGKHGNWNGYQRCGRKLYRVTLSATSVIKGLHAHLFSMTEPLQQGFQVTPEGEDLILKKNSTDSRFDKKMGNNGGE